jgi:hypothetical protein
MNDLLKAIEQVRFGRKILEISQSQQGKVIVSFENPEDNPDYVELAGHFWIVEEMNRLERIKDSDNTRMAELVFDNALLTEQIKRFLDYIATKMPENASK